ncbi:hypothetical protein [Agrococcus sp. ARC_14]|uniref:hypothetical protein n=1 Tax=Agrococcus sp. ARC_14 TaxID=2919927 RepID=UPI001F053845|nr:hypothetical protein [Agrococcus sp. ARC_14]MCH1883875.1 hypothetical protein [Agrococcus sp. ARC_14]
MAVALLLSACAAQPAATAPTAPGPSTAAEPTVAAEPTASATASSERCDDSFADGFIAASGYGFEGDAADRRRQADARAGFEPADALAALDVACALTFTAPWETPSGTRTVSVAVVESGVDVDAAMESFAGGAGYEQITATSSAGGGPWLFWELPASAAASETRFVANLYAREFGAEGPAVGEEALMLEASDAEAGDWMIMHLDLR